LYAAADPLSIIIPPSPAVAEPDANKINLSSTAKFAVFTVTRSPLTCKSPVTTKLFPTVVVPEPPPMFSVVAAPNALTVVAVVLNTAAVPPVVVMAVDVPLLIAKFPSERAKDIPVAAPMFGVVKVLPDSVSVPAKVANVPVVGRVTFVVAVEVKVVEYAPAVIKEPPFTIVRVADVAGAVIVTLFIEVAAATPSVGVVRVGDVANTLTPVPVLSVNADAKFADDGVPKKVATFVPKLVRPVPPFDAGSMPVTPEAKSTLVIVLRSPSMVLFVKVSVVALPTNVSVAAGKVNAVMPATAVALSLVVPEVDPLNVAPVPPMIGVVKVLLVKVSVVSLPTNVSVEVGKVKVPVLLIEEIIGVVNVLLESVATAARSVALEVLSTFPKPTIDFEIPPTVPVKVGLAKVATTDVSIAIVPVPVIVPPVKPVPAVMDSTVPAPTPVNPDPSPVNDPENDPVSLVVV
jgi:hypothetical protein